MKTKKIGILKKMMGSLTGTFCQNSDQSLLGSKNHENHDQKNHEVDFSWLGHYMNVD